MPFQILMTGLEVMVVKGLDQEMQPLERLIKVTIVSEPMGDLCPCQSGLVWINFPCVQIKQIPYVLRHCGVAVT